VLKVASHKELPLRMRTLGPATAQAGGAPRIAYPPPDARLELARTRRWRSPPRAATARCAG
jgi:hypothetical protein